MAMQHSNWDLSMQAAPQHLRETLLYYSAITACCRITAASQTHLLAFFPLPGHQYLICFPSLRWKCHCLSDPKVPVCYQRVVRHMQERADLEMKASKARVTWRWAFQENPCIGNDQQVLLCLSQAGLRTLPSISWGITMDDYQRETTWRWGNALSAMLEEVGEHRHELHSQLHEHSWNSDVFDTA